MLPDPPHPSARPPIAPENLPAYSPAICEAICVEASQSVQAMARLLWRAGWTPEQVGYATRNWSWTQVARAVAWERERRGERVADPETLSRLLQASPEGRLDAQIAADEQRRAAVMSVVRAVNGPSAVMAATTEEVAGEGPRTLADIHRSEVSEPI